MDFRSLYRLNLLFINAGGKVKYLLRLSSLSKTKKLLKTNEEIIATRKHDTIYICGLGPSLADVDLDRLYKKDTTFVWSTSFLSINPDLVNLDCKKTFLAMYNGYYIDPKKFELTKVMPAFGNVVCAAIAFAIGAGYKKIVLLGCDFNSFAFPHEVHCYDGGKENKAVRRISLGYELFCYCFDAFVHVQLAEYARTLGVEIINSTKGSLIDAYPMNVDETLYKTGVDK